MGSWALVACGIGSMRCHGYTISELVRYALGWVGVQALLGQI